MGDAGPDDVFGRLAAQRAAAEADITGPPHATCDRAERRGLAGAVGAEERDHSAFGHRERFSVEDGRRPVTSADVLELQYGGHAAPRYASMTAGLRCTSAGDPSAIFLPKSRTTTRSEMPITNAMWCSTRSIVTPSSV